MKLKDLIQLFRNLPSAKAHYLQIMQTIVNYQPPFPHMLFRAVIVAIVSLSLIIPLILLAIPYIEFFNEMVMQPKAKTQGTYGFQHKKELLSARPAPKNSLPQGYVPYPYIKNDDTLTSDSLLEIIAGDSLNNPRKIDMASLTHGKRLYNIYCIVCHGKYGEGNGPVVGPERFPAPPTFHSPEVRKYKDGRFYHIITNGKEKMAGYRDKILPENRWHVVNYIHVLHRAVDPRKEDFNR